MRNTKIIFVFCLAIFLSTGKNAKAQSITFYYTGSVQTWTVPCGVMQITISAIGGGGGGSLNYRGGYGATIVGSVSVAPGNIINIYAGGVGTANLTVDGGAGGGGSFIYDTTTSTLLEVAGGGGGAIYRYTSNGYDASTTTTPTGSNGGSGEGGGGAVSILGGGGGAGFLGNGATNGFRNAGTGGNDWANGFAGGAGDVLIDPTIVGGYGGGGGAGEGDGGGGAGYNGGGSGAGNGGGGGGSYVNGSMISGITTNAGYGRVIITWAGLTATGNIITNVTCIGGNTGSASSSASGGTAPYMYLWTPSSQTNSVATGLSARTYVINVTDACGNTASASVSITQPNPLVVSASAATNLLCNGGNNGITSSSVSGGTSPYTYLWTPSSQTNSMATGLSAGTYVINATDSCGDTASASVLITQPTAINISAVVLSNELCNGENTGSVSASVDGGTSPYTYLWSGGRTNFAATGLNAGTYTLTVTDANGCTSSDDAVISQPAAMSILVDSIPDDGNCTGSAKIIVSGGVSPYGYFWSNAASTSDSIYGQCKGTYCCQITDANQCQKSICVAITSTAGIDNVTSNSGQVTIYPNPNNGSFTLSLTNVNSNCSIEIYNVLGEKVFTETLPQSQSDNTINITGQPDGMYFYRVITNTGSLIGEGKVMVQK